MSKGSKPRPIPDPEKFRDNWDKVFNKKQKEKQDKPIPYNPSCFS